MPSATLDRMTEWLVKPVVFLACLLPALHLGLGVLNVAGVSLGADPVDTLLRTCGRWTLNFLMITLCMTPLRDATHAVFWLKVRRMFGLFAFFYGVAHFAIYLLLDQAGKLGALWEDIIKRPYITIGVIALLMLLPLAATSTARAQRRLGRRWTRLHQLIYVVAVLGVWHFWWQVKKDITQPVLYASGLAVLLGYRLYKERKSLALRFSGLSLATKSAS